MELVFYIGIYILFGIACSICAESSCPEYEGIRPEGLTIIAALWPLFFFVFLVILICGSFGSMIKSLAHFK